MTMGLIILYIWGGLGGLHDDRSFYGLGAPLTLQHNHFTHKNKDGRDGRAGRQDGEHPQ